MKRIFITTLLLASTLPHGAIGQEKAAAPTEADYYSITTFSAPKGSKIETTSIDFGPDEKVYVSTRHGEIWSLDNAYQVTTDGDPGWKLFARYLHEPLGLSWKDDWLYVTQRPELSRIKDEDGDGRADIFETVSDGWGITGDYHEYAFGSRHDKDDNIWVTLCLTSSVTSSTLFRGWTVRVTPDGEVIPTTCGIRSPGGIGFGPDDEVFYCDNQGLWNGSSSLKHLKQGSFQGNPNGNIWFEHGGDVIPEPPFPSSAGDTGRIEAERKVSPTFVPPAVVLPHGKVGQSPTGIARDESGGKFGPFAGQVFVAEQTHSEIQRCFLEKVNGVYQGACFKFLSGFKSGNIGLRLAPNGALFTGGSNRGWGARGGKAYNLERANWLGKIPFEVHEMRAKPDGFELTFTQPVKPETAVTESFKMSAYTYMYRHGYGSPAVDEITPEISVTSVAEDGKTIRLKVTPMTQGHVHQLEMPGLRNTEDLPLLHPAGYYTLNEIPKP